MADIVSLGSNFDLGFQSDVSRDELNPRAAFRMKDWIPQLEAPVRKRGGWAYGSPNLSGIGGTAASVAALGFLPWPSDGRLVAISNAGSIYALNRFDGSGGALVADTGDTSIVPTWPIFPFFPKTSVQYGIVLPGYTQGAKKPKKITISGGTVTSSLLGTGGTDGAPMARSGFSWGDYLVLMNYYDPSDSNNLHNNRMAWSDLVAGPNGAWALTGTTAATLDFPEELLAGVPVLNTILVFGYNNCWTLTGDTPPPGGNLVRKLLFAGLGTLDGRSCLPWRNYAVWANAAGVYQSDGATLTDLTADGGISVYYRQIVSGFAQANGWSMNAGIYRDHYVLTIRNASNVVVTTLVCDLTRKVWTEWTNVNGLLMVQVPAGPGTALYGGDEELFFAHATQPYVGKISPLWTPSQTYQADGDGTAVLPVLETPFYRVGSYDQKRIRRIYVGYDLRAGSGGVGLKVSQVLTPEPSAAYTALSPNMPSGTKYIRKNQRVGKFALGLGFKFELSAAAADAKLYSIEADAHPWEPER